MNAQEPTRQQLDPAGSVGIRTITAALGLGAVAYATVMTWVGWSEVSLPILAISAVLILAAACWLLFSAASSYRAPLSRNTHYLVVAMVLIAIVFETAGQSGTNRWEGNDWGAVCLGAVLVAFGPYRPARELASAGVLSAILIGFIALLEARQLATPGPRLAFVIVAVAPLLALSFAAAAFSFAIVKSIHRWQLKAQAATMSLVEELRGSIARSVQQESVKIIDQDVVPFFAQLLAAGEITSRERDRARTIADSIRRLMVADADRSWLETAVDLAIRPSGDRAIEVVDDPDRVAQAMLSGQRTAIRAFLVSVVELPRFSRADLRIALRARDGGFAGTISARLEESDRFRHSALKPYFAVMRAEFSELRVDFSRSSLILRFSYEQH